MAGEVQYQLDVSSPTPFDANGNSTILLGPNNAFERWQITRYSTSSDTSGCSLTIYRNFISVANYVDSTLNAANDTGGIQANLSYGEKLLFVYTMGKPGATVSPSVFGQKFIKAFGGYSR